MPKIIECAQGTPDWWMAKRGIPSASNFDRIMTPKTRKFSAQAEAYAYELIADVVLAGAPVDVESYTSRDMQNGIDLEPEARGYYAFTNGVQIRQVGFCISDCGRWGCSPDGLIGDDGGLELKCPKISTHLGYLIGGELPSEYKCQVHGSLIVTGRHWWDFESYAIGLSPFLIRTEPDDFTADLRKALEQFSELYAALMEKAKPFIKNTEETEAETEQRLKEASIALFG